MPQGNITSYGNPVVFVFGPIWESYNTSYVCMSVYNHAALKPIFKNVNFWHEGGDHMSRKVTKSNFPGNFPDLKNFLVVSKVIPGVVILLIVSSKIRYIT